jgi:Antitoxin SocA-like, Panacea domain
LSQGERSTENVAGAIEFNPQKFKELIVYLAQRSGGDPGFAATKLNKLMYFCDFEAYRQLGHSITGARYQKLEWGPAAVEFLPLQDELFGDERARLEYRERGGHTQRVTVPLSPADPSVFLPEEIKVIERVIERLRPFDATGSSDYSHRESAGWNAVEEREVIPYGTAVFSMRKIPQEDIDRARQLAAEENWASVRP